MKFKLAVVLSIVLSSASALASPAAGDYARFEGTLNSAPTVYELEITEYNAASEQYRQISTVTVQGRPPRIEDEWLTKSDFLTSGQAKIMVQMCTLIGGTPEKLNSPAGTFDTCRVAAQGGTMNIGSVPFSMVSLNMATADGMMKATLVQFRSGE